MQFVARLLQKSSIIDIWQSSKCASGILQNIQSENHLCSRPLFHFTLVKEIVWWGSATLLWEVCYRRFPWNFPWIASAFTRNHFSAFLTQFLSKSRFTVYATNLHMSFGILWWKVILWSWTQKMLISGSCYLKIHLIKYKG